MIDSEVGKIINKPHKNAEPARPEKYRCAAEFHRNLLFGIAS